MAANTSPIFPLTPVAGATTLTSAATEKDGSTATTLITAGENGTRLEQAIVKPIGTNVATVIRFFITGTGLNTILTEQTIAQTTASEVAALDEYVIPLNCTLSSGAVLKVAIGTAVDAGIQVTAFGGNY